MKQITVLLPVTIAYNPDIVKAVMNLNELLPIAGDPRMVLKAIVGDIQVMLENVEMSQASQILSMMKKDAA